jgi:hypothetical protein
VVGFFAVGHYLYKLPIGLDPSAFLFGDAIQRVATSLNPDLTLTVAGAVWALVLLLVVAIVAVRLVGMSRRAAAVAGADPGRRFFLSSGLAFGSVAVAGLAAGARGFLGIGTSGGGWKVTSDALSPETAQTHPEWKSDWKGSRVRNHRRLGRTGFEISDIVLGTGPLAENGEEIVRTALERGINYIDTSPDYSAAGSEHAVGLGIRGFPRDRLFIATKFCTPTGHLPHGTPVAVYKENVEQSLRRLGTDYVDLCHIHSCDEVERLLDPNVHEAFDQLKQEGKVRFLGFSTHTPRLVEVANAGIDSGRFDVMMLAYHHGAWGPLAEIIQRGRSEQDMGIVAMKTLKGAKHDGLAGFREHSDAFSQAALKWVLSNEDVSCAVISFFKLQHVDEYLYASGRPVTPDDVAILEEYDRQIAGTYCAPHCGVCLGSCSASLPIDDVLRYRMYFEDYGREKEAMQLYAALERNAAVCASCSAPCQGSCPLGIDIQSRMSGSHDLLTLS